VDKLNDRQKKEHLCAVQEGWFAWSDHHIPEDANEIVSGAAIMMSDDQYLTDGQSFKTTRTEHWP
jgi:hypothetical protein